MDTRAPLNRDAFLLVVLTLILFGFVMVYSATSVATRAEFENTHFIRRQLIWGAVALLGLMGAMAIPARRLRQLAPALFAVSVAALVLVLLVGTRYNHARRWFRFGGIGVHPSEIAKVGLLLFFAHSLARPPERVRSLRTFATTGVSAAVVCGLILIEPDFGGAFFLAGWALLFLLVAGVRWWYVGAAIAGAVPLGAWLVLSSAMHLRRLTTFVNPWSDPQGAGHQVVQSLIALGSGGWRGLGLGLSQQRLSFLPEAPTDFIFAIVGEQLGILGTGALLALFGLLLYFGARIVLAAPDRFTFLVGLGALSMLVLQALVNVAVVTASMPTKGTALPFISFGGSSLVWAAVSAGLVLNVACRSSARSERPRAKPRGRNQPRPETNGAAPRRTRASKRTMQDDRT